ncbi:MAG: PhnD/SsuA/transferrin family substrate-binding protein [Planctomycetales bacterium]|nr:PhnD/SsuA/transferrin family substrate-binding protein [Planctomycetales bacterium]
MTRPLHRLRLPASALGLLLTAALGVVPSNKTEAADPLSVIVMDPLAAPLSCPCVKGYAQREYEALAKHLEKQLGQPVRLTFSESLKTALKGDAKGKADLVIGKYSVVLADAVTTQQMLQPLAALSGKDGSTTQSGLIVVPAQDPAQKVTDLKGYRILFGPAECDEKHAAAMGLLKSKGVQWKLGEGGVSETCSACSDGATKILELGNDVRVATVISSYAQPLLQGCGTIKKGDLRVVAETAPVPFVTAFVHADLPKAKRDAIQSALFKIGEKPELCAALETLVGFLPFEPPSPEPPAKKKRGLQPLISR